ncbi:hypothetical protein RJ641_024121, partial [Dillenia turbinata]
GAFGGNRGLRPVPPEKGIFPLDHMRLCDLEKKDYLNCLKNSGHLSEKCRQFSKKYLECRMAKLVLAAFSFCYAHAYCEKLLCQHLMARQELSELGFGKESDVEASEEKSKEI